MSGGIDSDGLPLLTPAEFRDRGYLAEVNRRVLHPLGLAMGVDLEAPGFVVYDNRDDPEGWIYDASVMEEVTAKALAVDRELAERAATRIDRLGYIVQPILEEDPRADR